MKKQSNLSRLLSYAGKRKILLYLSWILSAVSAAMALMPFIHLWLIVKQLIEVNPDFSKATDIAANGMAAVFWAIGSMLVYICALMCSHLGAFRIAANLRIDVITHITKLPIGVIEKAGSGKLRKTIDEAPSATETYLAHQLPDKAGSIATPAVMLVFLFIFDWRLGLISLIPVVLSFFIMMSMTGKEMQRKMKEYQNALDDMSNEAVEYIRGIPVVKTFGQTVFSFKKFKTSIDRYGEWVISYTKQLRIPMIVYITVINGIFALLILAGIIFTQGGVDGTFLLNLIFYIIFTPIIATTLTKIMMSSENEMIVTDALGRIDTILNENPLPEGTGVSPADSSVELKNVTFSYDKSKNVIDDVSLRVEPGQTVAFVGPSGSGKTTLAQLVVRFFDTDKGDVIVGGSNVKDIPKSTLMDTVSFVFQNSRLIKGTIYENVLMGRPTATRNEVMAALTNAQCMDIIEKLPDRENTVIGTAGIYLSGGEQQRIAIARVMLKNAPIVIMDEATAFADPDNEVRVQQAMSKLSEGRTVIMIAHRLTTVLGADKIFVLCDGKITESGTAAELTASGGMFADMLSEYETSADWKVKEANV